MDEILAADRNAAARARARDTLATAGANYEAARSRLLQAIRSYRRTVVGQPSTTETIHTLAHSSLNLCTTRAIDRLLPSAPGSAAMVAEVNALFGTIGLPADMLTPGPNGGTVILSI